MTDERFETLPVEVQEKIKKTLRAYDSVFVTYEYGDYHFGCCLKSHYADDHRVVGEYFAKDIYTDEERIENYMNCFHSYPIQYKGKRDYKGLNEYEETHRGITWDLKLIDGNFVFT